MKDLVALDSVLHRSVRIRTDYSARYGDNQHFVPIVVTEFGSIAGQCPILVTKDSETGAFALGAQFGLEYGENLFLHEPIKLLSYRPLAIQRIPFYALGENLGLDMGSERVNDSDGEAVFNNLGQPTQYLLSVMTMLRALKQGARQTQEFLDALKAEKLLASVNIEFAFSDGRRFSVADSYSIDQAALEGLPKHKILEYFKSGYLQLIYLMIASLDRFHSMVRLKESLLPSVKDAG